VLPVRANGRSTRARPGGAKLFSSHSGRDVDNSRRRSGDAIDPALAMTETAGDMSYNVHSFFRRPPEIFLSLEAIARKY
jgi:hypothetical protein